MRVGGPGERGSAFKGLPRVAVALVPGVLSHPQSKLVLEAVAHHHPSHAARGAAQAAHAAGHVLDAACCQSPLSG